MDWIAAKEILDKGGAVYRLKWNERFKELSPYPEYTPKDRIEIKGKYIYILTAKGYVGVTDNTQSNRMKLLNHKYWNANSRLHLVSNFKTFDGQLQMTLVDYLFRKPTGKVVHFINGDTLDCRKSNVIFVTKQEKRRLVRGSITEMRDLKGVNKSKKILNYYAQVHINGKKLHIGSFVMEVDAGKAYDDFVWEMFGKMTYLNFPKRDLKPRGIIHKVNDKYLYVNYHHRLNRDTEYTLTDEDKNAKDWISKPAGVFS